MTRIYMGLLSLLYLASLIGAPVRCDETTNEPTITMRMQLYLKWLRGIANQEERDSAAKTIAQDGAVAVAIAAVTGGAIGGTIRWLWMCCQQKAIVHNLVDQLRNWDNATKEKEIALADIAYAKMTVRVSKYDQKSKTNIIFCIPKKDITWQSLPVLKKAIAVLSKQELFDKIQVSKMYANSDQDDQLIYAIERKNGTLQETIYPLK